MAFNKARGFSTAASAPLFVNRKHKRLSVRAVQDLIAGLREKAGLDVQATPQSLRHSFASAAVNATGDVRAVQQLLGHRRLNNTQIYIWPDQGKMAQVVAALE